MYIVQLRGTLIITAPTIRIWENKSEKDIPGVSKNWTLFDLMNVKAIAMK